jgi:hypothetical protein
LPDEADLEKESLSIEVGNIRRRSKQYKELVLSQMMLLTAPKNGSRLLYNLTGTRIAPRHLFLHPAQITGI